MSAFTIFDAWGVKVFRKNVKLKVPPMFEYHYGVKSVYEPFRILILGTAFGDLKLTNRTINAILKNCKIVIF